MMPAESPSSDALLNMAEETLNRLSAARVEIDRLAGLDALSEWVPHHPHRPRCEYIHTRLPRIADGITSARERLENIRAGLHRDGTVRFPFVCPEQLQQRMDLCSTLLGLALCRKRVQFVEACRRPGAAAILPPRIQERVGGVLESYWERRQAAEWNADQVAARNSRLWRNLFRTAMMEDWTGPWVEAVEHLQASRMALDREYAESQATQLRGEVERHLDDLRRSLVESLANAEGPLLEFDRLLTQDADAVRAMQRVWRAVDQVATLAPRQPPQLDEVDLRLIALWARALGASPYWFAAMRSARAAELIALAIYREIYGDACDLSVLQTTAQHDERWHTADIESADRWIDVKNARRAFSSPNSYSEYTVKSFKQRTDASADVVISAFLSPYRADPSPYDDDGVLWLGETTWHTLEELAREFTSDYLAVPITRGEVNRLPPWMFDYPGRLYQQRNDAIARVRAPDFVIPRHDCPLSILILARRSDCCPPTHPAAEEANALCERLSGDRLPTRPLLFLHVLDRFCQKLREGAAFPAKALVTALVPDHSASLAGCAGRTTPLAVLDPLGTVTALIDVLTKVDATCREQSRAFTKFRLPSVGIFQGLRPDGEWQTLLAYCGGWRTIASGRVRCGQNPLFLGQDAPCGRCGKLACHVCGFCSQTCPESAARQEQCRPAT